MHTALPAARSSAPSHLTAAQLDALRSALELAAADKRDLLAGEQPDGNGADREVFERLAAHLTDGLDDVEHALARIADGTYGTCETCGSPIPFERLEALPETRWCVRCRDAGR